MRNFTSVKNFDLDFDIRIRHIWSNFVPGQINFELSPSIVSMYNRYKRTLASMSNFSSMQFIKIEHKVEKKQEKN